MEASKYQLSPVASSEHDHDSDDLQVETNAEEQKGLIQGTEEEPMSSTSQTWSPIVSESVGRDLSIEFTEKNADKEKSTHADEKQPSSRVDTRIVRRYMNPGGNFFTGMDLVSTEAAEKRVQRAQRFGLEPPKPNQLLDKIRQRSERFMTNIPESGGELIKFVNRLPDIPAEGKRRPEAILLHGTDDMSTEDVFEYFLEYSPNFVEWINDSSCNAVWEDPASARRALYGQGKHPAMCINERDSLPSSALSKSQDELPWRLGEVYPKSKQLLLRFATTADIKERNAAQKSKYYRKYNIPTAPTFLPRRRRESGKNRLEGMEDDMEWVPETGVVLPIGGDGDLRSRLNRRKHSSSETDKEGVAVQREQGARSQAQDGVGDLRKRLNRKRHHKDIEDMYAAVHKQAEDSRLDLIDDSDDLRNSLSRKRAHRATGVTKSTVAVMIAAAAAAAATAKATSLSSSQLSDSTTKKTSGTLYSDNIGVEETQTSSSSTNKEGDLRCQLLSKQKRKTLMARLGWQRKT